MTGIVVAAAPATPRDRQGSVSAGQASGKRDVLETLHGMRGVAAIAVVAWHEAALPWFSVLPGSGYLAVDLFFVLSGLVLARAYDKKLATTLTPAGFIISRLIRVYPLYAVGLLLTSAGLVVAFALGVRTNWSVTEFGVAFGFALLFVPTPPLHSSAIYPLNNPAWSLFFELVANAVFGLFWKRLTTSALIVLVAASAAILIGAGISHGNLDLGSNWPTFWVGFPRVTYSFFLGVLLHRLLAKQVRTPWVTIRTTGSWIVLAITGILLAAYPENLRAIYDLGCVLLVFPLLVCAGVLAEPRGVSRKIFIALGAASYPMYAIHVPLLTIVGQKSIPGLSTLGPAFGGLVIVALLGAGLLLDRVDRIVRARLTRLSVRMLASPVRVPATIPQ